MMSITSVGAGRALLDLVFVIVVMVLSEGEGEALVSPRSAGASWTISCLISEVTTRASEVEIVVAS